MDYPSHTDMILEEAETKDWTLSLPRKSIDTTVLCRALSSMGVYSIIIRSDRSKVNQDRTGTYTVELYKYSTNEYGDRIGEEKLFENTYNSIEDAISTMEEKITCHGIKS